MTDENGYPEKPTCHARDTDWRNVETIGPYRTCSYCGSIHPEDLLRYIASGATLGGADWKYGTPHKFYVYRTLDRTYPKWYNAHLLDEGYSFEALRELLAVLSEKSGIIWTRDEQGHISYHAPYHGYQNSGY